ncbi:MAG TPA: glycosyltransferase [Bryobacteraceae bacterium]|nr:glycosyltransferase [Bryobacteraceae bacterium]
MPRGEPNPVALWRFSLLFAAIRLGWIFEVLLRPFPRKLRRLPHWRPGVSIVIPECGTPDVLEHAIDSAFAAAGRLDEELELIVAVNGAPLSAYARLQQRFPQVRWLHDEKRLGFSGAIEWGVNEARFDWVYLLNSDMFLAPEALTALMPWRAAHVFAVASQVFFADASRRREETGWTGFRVRGGSVEIFDVLPEDATTVRGHLYAGGGASLFRRELLLRLLSRSHPYNPVYWEDVEWGVRAWQAGYEVLFCPTSHATHLHRATVSRIFSKDHLERILWRNQLLFAMRNGFLRRPRGALLRGPTNGWDDITLRELSRPRQAFSLLAASWTRARAPARLVDLERVDRKFYLRPPQTGTRSVIVVSPFAVYPPGHGGARRIANLLQRLADDFNIVLLSDEEALYEASVLARVTGPICVHLTGGRRADTPGAPRRIARIRSHSHPRIQVETEWLAATYAADLVQIEYIELAALIENRKRAVPWVITLHDVLFCETGESPEDRFEAALIAQHDAVIACSAEDAALVRHKRVVVVPNAVTPPGRYVSSRGSRQLLFTGPFRYEPNLAGILKFLEAVYPALRREIPDVELCVLGGRDASLIARQYEGFAQPGVRVVDHVDDVAPWLEACALTINPVTGVRGSSIKLLESLGFGRVCISTEEGARGFRDLHSSALLIVPGVNDFLAPLRELLLDEERRLQLEKPDSQLLESISWERAAFVQAGLYRELLR